MKVGKAVTGRTREWHRTGRLRVTAKQEESPSYDVYVLQASEAIVSTHRCLNVQWIIFNLALGQALSSQSTASCINRDTVTYADMDDEKQKAKDRLKKLQSKMEIDNYAEWYPGMVEAFDAIEESEDEVDYTKMDQGNKKGPIGRWDFDTQEEYSD
ncbi:uncharacterized protein LOC124119875 [Haliotis rufescens]|uniref:uncharacterized protein LOC124119875 n=1 Tax=Haliotis rufescens TaxID=6454 RepID=UPI00201F1C26|nr:uncharacterized protein LOC124119875 [Haliotis rufescens]